jgi:hypothetical protein
MVSGTSDGGGVYIRAKRVFNAEVVNEFNKEDRARRVFKETRGRRLKKKSWKTEEERPGEGLKVCRPPLDHTACLNTVIYMQQALDGTPLAADRPFIPTVQVAPAAFKLKSSIILIS